MASKPQLNTREDQMYAIFQNIRYVTLPWQMMLQSYSQTKQQYTIRSKGAISLIFDLHCKAIAALFFIPYCSLI